MVSVDIDECQTGDIMCEPNSICTNAIGSFTCECLPGYRTNESTNGTCAGKCESTYHCIHVTSLQPTLLDVDECSEGTPCDQNASCFNVEGFFTCTCLTGFSGNGTFCGGSHALCILATLWQTEFLPNQTFTSLV